VYGTDGKTTVFQTQGRTGILFPGRANTASETTVAITSISASSIDVTSQAFHTPLPSTTPTIFPYISIFPNGTEIDVYSNGTVVIHKLVRLRPGPRPGSIAGVTIGSMAAVGLLLAIFFLVRKRRSRNLQNTEINLDDDLPEVCPSDAEKTNFSRFAGKSRPTTQVSEISDESNFPAEISGGTSVKRKPLARNVAKPVPAELASHDGLVMDHGIARQVQAQELLPKAPVELSGSVRRQPQAQDAPSSFAEFRSDTATPKPGREVDLLAEQGGSSARAEASVLFPSPTLEQPVASQPSGSTKNTKAEELAQLKETVVRLEERRRRLMELNKIEEEEENVRKRIAGLEGRG
jgi:hypothetical protein